MEWWAFICHLLVNKGSTPCVEVVVSGREGGRVVIGRAGVKGGGGANGDNEWYI